MEASPERNGALFPGPFYNAVKDLIETHEVSQQDIALLFHTEDSALRAAMQQHRQEWGLDAPFLQTIIGPSATIIEHSYVFLNFEEKKAAALYTWYCIYCDDVSATTSEPFAAFEANFLRGIPQLDPVLDALASVLRTMFDLYPAFYANSIVNAAFQFMNSLSVERELESGGAESSNSLDPQRFPWFLRHSTGVSLAYALLLFPKTIHLEPIPCFKAQADMDFWICVTNDILSYHKECAAGDTANYICNRARVESKSQLEVISDLVKELQNARKAIYNALKMSSSPAGIEAWRHFERGYIGWHFTQASRYKLDKFYNEIFDITTPGTGND